MSILCLEMHFGEELIVRSLEVTFAVLQLVMGFRNEVKVWTENISRPMRHPYVHTIQYRHGYT